MWGLWTEAKSCTLHWPGHHMKAALHSKNNCFVHLDWQRILQIIGRFICFPLWLCKMEGICNNRLNGLWVLWKPVSLVVYKEKKGGKRPRKVGLCNKTSPVLHPVHSVATDSGFSMIVTKWFKKQKTCKQEDLKRIEEQSVNKKPIIWDYSNFIHVFACTIFTHVNVKWKSLMGGDVLFSLENITMFFKTNMFYVSAIFILFCWNSYLLNFLRSVLHQRICTSV